MEWHIPVRTLSVGDEFWYESQTEYQSVKHIDYDYRRNEIQWSTVGKEGTWTHRAPQNQMIVIRIRTDFRTTLDEMLSDLQMIKADLS